MLRLDGRRQRVMVGTHSCEINVPGWYFDDDRDAIHSGADL